MALHDDEQPALLDTSHLTMRRFDPATLAATEQLPLVDRRGLPPGPRWPALLQAMVLLRFRHWAHPYLHRRYGDAFTVRAMSGGRPLVLYTRPEHAKEILSGDAHAFHGGKGNRILAPVMGEHSLFIQDGEDHHRARKLLLPAFNGSALRSYRELIGEIAHDEVCGWPVNRTIRTLDRLNAFTLEVILRVVFGVTDPERLGALRPRVAATVGINPLVLMALSSPRAQRFRPCRVAIRNQVELDRLIYAEIRERRTAADLAERPDVLSRLLRIEGEGGEAMAEEELRDQLVTLLLAGHETTATAVAWALYELGRDRELMRRTQSAVDASDEAGEAWLQAVLMEAIRRHPGVAMVVRTMTEPRTVGGHEIPPGASVAPSIVELHRRSDLYPDPERFDPERFLGQGPPPHAWLGFGGGVRRCIGGGFALMEGTAILREVFGAFDVIAVGTDKARVRNVTSVPARGARIRVSERR